MASMNDVTTEDDSGVAETGPMAAAEAVTGADHEAQPPNRSNASRELQSLMESMMNGSIRAMQKMDRWMGMGSNA
ncbi:hypothetical protein V6N11_058776 [Hibiscus sabdariffa]|uniref:Uncharacterized protein n=1 Tax=Hibiscus sabdariffa TaxID=183260 RepID=A0ABR2U5H8_9ROSI